MFAEIVKKIPMQSVLQRGEGSCRFEHGGKLHVHTPLFLQLVRRRKSVPSESGD
jgi:hypothetical protein